MTHTLTIRSSLRLALILCVLHVLVLVVCVVLWQQPAVPRWAPLACLALTACSLVQSWRLWRIDEPWMLSLPELGDPVLVHGEHREWVAMQPGCIDFSGIWIVLRWRFLASGRSRAVCLMADSTDSEAWRQLRIWLRWRAFSLDRPSGADL